MGRKYKMVRLPEETFLGYVRMKNKMELDIQSFTGKKIKMTMPKVFDAFVNPKVNRTWMVIDKKSLVDLAKTKRGKNY